jgi:hypothetical protein
VKVSLVGKFNGSVTGSAKCDAYIWAKQQYLDQSNENQRQANGTFLAYVEFISISSNYSNTNLHSLGSKPKNKRERKNPTLFEL